MKLNKTVTLCALMVVGGIFAGPTCTTGQTNVPQQAQPTQTGPRRAEAQPPARGPGLNIDQRVQLLTERLSLTREQQTKLRAIFEDERAKMQQLRTNTAIAPEERRVKAREIREQTNNRIREMLTPEQKEKFDALPRPQVRQPREPGAQTNQPAEPRGPRGPRPDRPERPNRPDRPAANR